VGNFATFRFEHITSLFERPTMMKSATLFPDLDEADSAENTIVGLQPVPFHNRTLPSRAAAESARPSVRNQCMRVLEFISSQGERGATDKEVQRGLGMAGDSQRPRRVWLRNNGFLQPKGSPEEIVLRDGSTVWVAIHRQTPLTSNA
jgi:hypothetical protein